MAMEAAEEKFAAEKRDKVSGDQRRRMVRQQNNGQTVRSVLHGSSVYFHHHREEFPVRAAERPAAVHEDLLAHQAEGTRCRPHSRAAKSVFGRLSHTQYLNI